MTTSMSNGSNGSGGGAAGRHGGPDPTAWSLPIWEQHPPGLSATGPGQAISRSELPVPGGRDEVADAVGVLRPVVADALTMASRDALPAGGPAYRLVEQVVQGVLDGHARDRVQSGLAPLPAAVEDRVRRVLVNAFGALGGLQPLLDDDSIETININGCDRVFVQYRDGTRAAAGPVADTDDDLVAMLQALASGRSDAGGRGGGGHERRFDHGSPQLQLSLPGGARLHAVMVVSDRPSVSIRKHPVTQVTLADLVQVGELSEGLAQLLSAMVRARRNIIISGGPATGKTTLLRALAGAIPARERIITVEDVYELNLSEQDHPDLVREQVREPNVEGAGGFDVNDLVKGALRMTPDRVIVGEIRGPESVYMAKAMSTGMDGSMATVHASSSAQALHRLVAYAMEPGAGYSHEAATALIAGAVHAVVHLGFGNDRTRVVTSVREVLDDTTSTGSGGFGVIATNEIYTPGPSGPAVPGTPPRCLDLLCAAGFDPGWLDQDRHEHQPARRDSAGGSW